MEFQDGNGGTTFYTAPAAAVYGGATLTFPTPLRQPTAATALYCKDNSLLPGQRDRLGLRLTRRKSMAIGTPQEPGTTAPTGTSLSRILTITHNVNVGQFIGVFVSLGSSRTPLFSDSAGNSYTSTSIALPGISILWFGYCANPTTGMTSGVGTITADWSASAAPDDPTMSAFQVSGVDLTTPISVTGSVASGTGMTISPALTITPAAANELAVAVTAVNGAAGAYVTDAGHGWTLLNKVQEAAGGQASGRRTIRSASSGRHEHGHVG